MGAHTGRPPADQGLSSLGLIMSLTGSVMAPLMGAMLLAQVKIAADRAEAMSSYGLESDAQTLWLFLILIASVVRSLVHRMAGMRLWRDTPSDPPALSGISTYVTAAAAHTALWAVYIKVKLQGPLTAVIGAVVVSMAWPLAVFAVTRLRRFRELGARPPVAEDNGFEGLAVLMAILGFVGLLFAIVIAVLGFSSRDESSGLANVLLLCAAGLLVRSIIHVSVGARALRGTAVNAVADFMRYANVGIAIGAAVGALLSIWTLTQSIDVFALAMCLGATLALLAWPAIVRSFVTWRHLADVATDTVRRRSPDAGITALGWLLLAGAAAMIGTFAASTLWEDSIGRRSAAMLLQMTGIPFDSARPTWALLLGLAELWAALELLAVSPRRRLVASAWAAAAIVVTTIHQAPGLRHALDAGIEARATVFAGFLIALSPAVATLILVNRKPLPPDVDDVVKTFA